MVSRRMPVIRRILCTLLVCALLTGLLPAAFAAGSDPDFSAPADKVLISQTNYPIVNGLTESQVILNNASGSAQVLGYMATITPGASVKLKASYPNYYTAGSTAESRAETAKNLGWDLKTTTSQAAAYEAATGETVVTAVNADYYNMQTAQCRGYLIMEGHLIQTHENDDWLEPYFAVLKDGSYDIRDYGTPTDDVAEAISGPFWLLKDGKIQDGLDASYKAPRNSIGLKEDGTLVIFMADGRQGLSDGMTVYEMAEVLQAQGCVKAIYLDGGGSATYASRHEGSNKLTIQNHPSDGPERVVASTLMIVSTAQPTGRFDHAALSPKNDLFLAGASVQFTATGVDSNGYPADLPANVSWGLEDSSFGTIDANGLFRSNGKCGTVTAQLLQGKTVLGTTSVEVQEPEELFFAAETLNLSFQETSDLGLTAKSGTRLMDMGGYVFDWTITPTDPGKKPSDIGSFSGNTFTAVKARETLEADITVSYTKHDGTKLTDSIHVEIGRMPQVLLDFEPDAEGKLMQGAEYDWGNAQYGAKFGDESMELTFINWDKATNAPATVTEKGPFQFGGTYIGDYTDETYYPACYVLGSAGYSLFTWHASYMKEHSATVQVVNGDEGETRFGDYSMRLDYDYTDLLPGYRNVNEYLYYADTSDAAKTDLYSGISLDGTPSGLGVWVYAPKGTPNYWLWTQIAYYDEASGTYKRSYLHFTTQEGRSLQYTGIYWEGWMYCEADLRPFAQYVTKDHPLKILNGQPLVLLTYIPGGSANENGDKIPMGSMASGSLYFDNFRVVYGDTVDDLENPVIDAVKAGAAELAEDGTTELKTNRLTLTAEFHDPAGENATGINPAKTAISVDGQRQTLTASTEGSASVSVLLPNGTHSITVSVCDGFGNVTNETRYFTVNAASTAYGSVTLTGEANAVIGEDYALTLNAAGSRKISSVTMELRLTDTFGAPEVSFENGYTGTYTYEKNVLKLQATSASPKLGAIATVKFHVPSAAARGSLLTYTLEKVSFTDGGTALSFAQPAQNVGVTAAYELTADIMTVGGNGKLYVKTADGKAPGRVQIYTVVDGQEDTLLGTTNAAGVLVTNRFCQTAGEKFTVYAKGEAGLSFRCSGVTNGIGSTEVAPTNIRLNAVQAPATTQNISWFAAPDYTARNAVVQYTTEEAYISGNYSFTTAQGTSTVRSFTDGYQASLVNSVTLTGLTPATTYSYRVGDGVEGHWSDVRTFTTAESGGETSFFVMGDTQLSGNVEADAADIEVIHQIAEAIGNANTDFGIQTGDFIDNAGSLTAWNEILDVFSDDFPASPIVQVLGNHEYYGDLSAGHAMNIFGTPDADYYSVEYGNVYIAVVNCNADLNAAAAWLQEDAAKTTCEWKLLTVHQPPYYTNPKGSSAAYNRILPAAIDAAGIDVVFSGHDHAYARTEQLTGGEVAEKGTTYVICGDMGEKSRDVNYAAVDDPAFHFAKISQSYQALYLLVNTTRSELTVTAYDLNGSVVDTFTVEHDNACRDGHSFVFDRLHKTLICSVCGETAPANYTGWATDKTSGKQMYFLAGEYKTGWMLIGTSAYHFDLKNGTMHKTTILEDVPTTCSVQGHLSVKCECGETYETKYDKPSGHSFSKVVADDGTVYYHCDRCGKISTMDMPFVDVDDTDWFAEAVYYCYQNSLLRGRSEMSFDPDAAMTRAELVTVLWRIAGSPNSDNVGKTPFTDVPAGSWYTAAVNWCSENKIVNGIGDGLFAPDDQITREQIVTILYRFAKFRGLDVGDTTDLAKKFTDAARVSDYAKEALSWAVAVGIINGMPDNTIAPQNSATRAEVATIIMRYTKLVSGTEN